MIFTGGAYRELQREVRETRDIAVEARTEGRSHQQNCIEHNQRVEAMLREGRTINENRHCENQDAIDGLRGAMNKQADALHGRVTALGKQMMLMSISALAAIVVALVGALYAIFSHKLGLS